MSRIIIPGRWSRDGRAIPDPQASELDNVIPLHREVPIEMTVHRVSRVKRLRRAWRAFVDFILAPCWG